MTSSKKRRELSRAQRKLLLAKNKEASIWKIAAELLDAQVKQLRSGITNKSQLSEETARILILEQLM